MAKDSLAAGTQFKVIHIPSGLKIDLVFKRARAFSAAEFGRRRTRPLRSGAEVSVASPEDLVLAKLEFFRDGGSDKHLRDIAGILRVSGDLVDRDYIERWADQLGVADIWHDLFAQLP
ncbi:MAG: hypothetical protein HZB16_12480 [Armatimonadetes bacterium]|nr:hypothetical protein [Armatimonadota bacterium]